MARSHEASFTTSSVLFRVAANLWKVAPVRRIWLRYWCTQRANAGPGLFEQEAVSVSPFLVIETAPCGHVTDASVSPALQANLQFDEPPQLSCLTTCKEAPPLALCSPFGPASPLSPFSPFGPGGPGGPCSPLMPCGPGGPCSPFAPCGPGWPCSPFGPVTPAQEHTSHPTPSRSLRLRRRQERRRQGRPVEDR